MENTINYNWLSFTSFSYITESESKVREAMLNLLPEDLRDESTFERKVMHGQYNDRILKLELRFTNKKKINQIVSNFQSKISSSDKKGLTYNFKNQWDEQNRIWHLRINKQQAYLEKIKLDSGGDIIKWTLKFTIYDTSEKDTETVTREFLKENGLFLSEK
ncbi:MAG: RNA-binding domain-containing protein [Candidatus Kariarchaeaceae archaeon]